MVLGLTLDKGASNVIQFQALPRPQQKLHLFAAHEEGIGPRTLSRLTGVPYSIVQRATSDAVRYGSMVCESLPGDEEYETYIDDWNMRSTQNINICYGSGVPVPLTLDEHRWKYIM